jgi:hypothetical protein
MAATMSGRAMGFGDAVWIAFVLTQAADGVLTYLGFHTFGLGSEGNPIVAWYVSVIGASGALVGAKALSVACAAFLHVQGRHAWVAVLTGLCLSAAVGPWISLLWG